jgi:hypothetical protein
MSARTHGGALLALLAGVVGGCGYRTQPGSRYVVKAADPQKLAGAHTEHGWFVSERCAAVCGEGFTECRLATVAAPPRPPRADCKYIPDGHTEEMNNDGPIPPDVDTSAVKDGDGLPLGVCQQVCGPDTTRCSLRAPAAIAPDEPFVLCRASWEGGAYEIMRMPAGRMPSTLHVDTTPARDVGAYFAQAAELEAASVVAFEMLEDELRAFDAPASLGRRARRARRDEVRHARAMASLAGVPRVRARKAAEQPRRSLEAMLVENAREGCVGETVGALLAVHQATHAREAKVRAAMARVAKDEARHAALAWAVHEALMPRLSSRARAAVEAELAKAFEAYQAGLAVGADVAEEVGLPTTERLRAMLSVLQCTGVRGYETLPTAPFSRRMPAAT